MLQDIDDPKIIRTLFECSDNLGCVTNVFYGINDRNNCIMLVLNDCVIFEIDINRTDFIADSIVSNFIFKNKTDAKNKKNFKFEYNNNYFYSVFQNYDENSNPKTIWKFYDKIVTMKFRPKIANNELTKTEGLFKGNHLAISFDGGRLKVFHFETKAMVADFKTHFGNILGIGYTDDGKVMGLGTESDNVFIVDAEFNKLIYCLEGHKNYINTIIFQELFYIDEDDMGYASPYKNTKSEKNLITLKTNIPINRELALEEFASLVLTDTNEDLDLRQLRRNRTVINPNQNALQDELQFSSVYDVYTAGFDGQVGIWRIEYFYNEGERNELNYMSYPINKDSNQVVKLDTPSITNLIPNNDIRVYYSSMVQVINAPLGCIHLIDNVLVYISRRNTIGSSVYLRFYTGIEKADDNDNVERKSRQNSFKKRTSSMSPTKKRAPTSEISESTQATSYFNTPKIVRGKSVQRINK
jgi:hypothetical protein